MDYEKKYKEALERAKKYKLKEYLIITQDIFPELAESEDERIRKEILDLVSISGNGNQFEEIKNWLEKQGTPAKLTEEEQNRFAKCVLSSCAMSFINYLDAHLYEGKMCVSNGECEDIENAFQNAMWDKLHRYYCKFTEKQKEPHYTKRNALFDKCVAECDPAVMKEVSDEIDEMLGKEQKPAEWSEEDERIRAKLLSYFNGFEESTSFGSREVTEIRHWLKSLRPRTIPLRCSGIEKEIML